MTSKLPKAVEAYIAAYNSIDVGGMLSQLSEDVVFKNLSGGELTAEAAGKEAFRALAQAGAAAFSERRQSVRRAITVAEVTLAEIDYRAVVAADLPNGWKAGRTIELEGASLFRLEGGLIAEIIDQS